MSSIYLLQIHNKESDNPSVCDINDKVSCTLLAQSKYSSIAGIPIAAMGIVGYIVLLLTAITHFHKLKENARQKLKQFQLSLASIAMLFTIYLIITEIIVGILCLGCLVSQISITIIFILSYIYYFKQ